MIKNICEDCQHYFKYESLVTGQEKSTFDIAKFSSCLKYGTGFQIQNAILKNYTQSCSQFKHRVGAGK